MLAKSLAEFGDLSCVIFNRKTGQIVGGHQRVKNFDKNATVEIVATFKKPTKVGTTAEGFIVHKGEKYKYREVEWDEVKEKAAAISANKNAGEWDLGGLAEWMSEIQDFSFDLDLTMFDEIERAQFLLKDLVNRGTENEAWAQMGEEHEFRKSEAYIALAIHFKTEAARVKFVEENDVHVDKKLKTVWISHK